MAEISTSQKCKLGKPTVDESQNCKLGLRYQKNEYYIKI